MINIRKGVFETNSSSSHSLSLTFNNISDLKSLKSKLELNQDGSLLITGEDFTGIEFEIGGAQSKAVLIATYIVVNDDKKLKQRFESALKEHTGCTNIVYDIRFFAQDGKPANTFYFPDIEDLDWYANGEDGSFKDILRSKKRIISFIFDDESFIDANEHTC